jgi:hypothetical protein
MIADDIRAATIYEPQDTSAIAELMAASKSSDDDSNDDSNDGSRSEGAVGLSGANTPGSAGGAGSSAYSSGGGSTSTSSSSSTGSSEETDGTLPLGLSGTLDELYIDVTRLPRRDELFATITGYTNAPMPLPAGGAATSTPAAAAGIMPPSDLKTVRYFLRQGEQVDAASVAATFLSPELRQRAGGLVRQEIPRAMRTFAELSGNSALLDSGQVLVAPEVVHLEFRYYDGQQVSDVWDMQEEESLPLAVEVRIWLASSEIAGTTGRSQYDLAGLVNRAREYRQTVYLPMSAISGAGAGGFSDGSSSSSSSSADSSSSNSSSAAGSSSGPP